MPKPYVLATTLTLLLFTLLCAVPGGATEKFAAETGRQCRDCHIDPLGGGALTDLGKGYALSLHHTLSTQTPAGTTISRLIRITFGFIHIVTAFLWFGTILYVHLVLKPAYASLGLPPGEVKVGLVSMAIMAVTGAVLTYYKVPSLHLLFTSKFGLLLLAKIIIFMVMVLSALFVVLFLGPRLKKKGSAQLPTSGAMTAVQLSSFDGKEGRRSYIAYKGKILDVSQSRLWRNGSHMMRHQAGVDLTEILGQAPHGEDKLAAIPEVGRLVSDQKASPPEMHQLIFYVMAYMNLGCVFLICFILALWRWS